ncbi:unnamed protein product [Mytilus coruscus]|uniref:Tyr recombinase domain-containing protein n=1 Tax=Mytilus coruscus TaxID=42192 RepID=A0A6J8ABZ8_MYTCO|nr:unnamed protein product [Mytilus coruscus]
MQKVTQTCSSALVMVLKALNIIKTKGDMSETKPIFKDLFKVLTHGICTANRKRKQMIRPIVPGKYRKLCEVDTPVTEFLFGDNLDEKVDKLDKDDKSDASKTGWGGFNKTYQLTDNGFWTYDEILEHINFLELKAALLTLQSLGDMLHDTHICLTYEEYVRKTETLRNKEQKVFISTVKPYKPVTKSTIARWVKTVMKSSGINIECFGPHSCRSASTSAALGQGLKLDTIMKSAGWKSAKTFQKFYNKTIITDNESNLAQKILPSSS